MASETLPVVAGDKDRSLQEVLNRLTSSRAPLGAEAEPIVTAIHRLPAMAAEYGPYPEGVDDRLVTALARRGIEQLYTCLLYTSPSPRDGLLSRMPSSA